MTLLLSHTINSIYFDVSDCFGVPSLKRRSLTVWADLMCFLWEELVQVLLDQSDGSSVHLVARRACSWCHRNRLSLGDCVVAMGTTPKQTAVRYDTTDKTESSVGSTRRMCVCVCVKLTGVQCCGLADGVLSLRNSLQD